LYGESHQLYRPWLLQANPKAKAAVEKVCAACLKAGVAVGCSTGDMETATQIMKLVEGHGWINMGGDGAGATVARGSPFVEQLLCSLYHNHGGAEDLAIL
jgi:hypothetical protein